jgi:hypothetical protein
VVQGWTEEQRAQAMEWATAAHQWASDNDVAVPPRPEFLKEFDVIVAIGEELVDDQADEDHGGTPFQSEYPQAEIDRMAESCAVWEIDNEKPVKICYVLDQPHVITGREPSKDAENWVSVSAWQVLPLGNVGEGNARTIREANAEYEKQFDEPESDYKPLSYKGVKINCGSKKKPDWWVIVGSEQRFTVDYSANYPDDEIEAAVDSDGAVTDDFTAERCDECGRIDGAHTKDCPKNPDRLTFEDYLGYCKTQYKTNAATYARRMELNRDPGQDEFVREWKQRQQAGSKPEPEKKSNDADAEKAEMRKENAKRIEKRIKNAQRKNLRAV